MENINNAYRIVVLEEVLTNIKNGDGDFICNEIIDILDLGNPFEVFPELKKHKPKEKRLHQCWFGLVDEGRTQRIRVLEALIKEIKEQPEKTKKATRKTIKREDLIF